MQKKDSVLHATVLLTDNLAHDSIDIIKAANPSIQVYTYVSVQKKLQEEREKLKHEKELLELEARALRAQMNPHFIFNCMNSIKALIQNDEKQKSIDYLTTFSKLIRTLFNNSDKRQISLYDELETCRLYLQLEAMRLEGKLSYRFDIDDRLDLKSLLVPALIIQPFIENKMRVHLCTKRSRFQLQ